MPANVLEIRPQPGPQEQFLSSSADIAIYGGAAGSGKSYAAILETLRHIENPKFGGVLFRRTSPELTGAGSIWEEAKAIYHLVGAVMRESPALEVRFLSGALMQFLHLQHADDVHAHQSKQYALVLFEELTHFEAYQFWYLVSRMRSTSGVRPYMRATTNPDPDSFVRELIAWWIDEDTGRAIDERSGVLRWFIRRGNDLHWGDSREELLPMCGPGEEPLSLTFIKAKLDDNKALLNKDPGYRSRLMAMPEVERERLLGGNWNIRPDAGRYVKDEYFAKRWTVLPKSLAIYATSDFAVTEPTQKRPNPDFTEHGFFGLDPSGDIYVIDWWCGQTTPDVWIGSLLDKAVKHKPRCWFGEDGVIRRSIEPLMNRMMRERRVNFRREWLTTSTGRRGQGSSKQGYEDSSKQSKAARGRPFQAYASTGRIIFPANAEWVERVVSQCVGFPTGMDDAFDVMSHMCLAIDQAHPAIDQKARPKKKPHDYDSIPARTGGWKTV